MPSKSQATPTLTPPTRKSPATQARVEPDLAEGMGPEAAIDLQDTVGNSALSSMLLGGKAGQGAGSQAAISPAPEQAPTPAGTGLEKDVDEMVKKSPTLAKALETLQKDGWTIQYGTKGKGTYADRSKKKIVIDEDEKGKTKSVVESLAHEGGHALYRKDPYVEFGSNTKGDYVSKNTDRDLKDEGEATITNIKVKEELAAHKIDIGVAGSQSKKYQELYDKYKDPKDRDKLREEIGKVFAQKEVPSVKKADGTSYKDYEEYYSRTYKEHWDKHHKGS